MSRNDQLEGNCIMDIQLFKLTLNICAYHENSLTKTWNALSAPRVGEHVHTHMYEYQVTEVHWPTTEEKPPHPVPVNLVLKRIVKKENKT